MCDSLKTNLCLPSSFITHHSVLNAMSLFRLRTQNHWAIPTHTYHFEDNMRNLYGDHLCTRCTTNKLGCETHAILEYTFSKHLAFPLIQKLRSLLSKAGQTSWDSLPTSQQISIILGNPPSSLPTKLYKVWTETTLNKILPYVSSLETLRYTWLPTKNTLNTPHGKKRK